MLIRGTCLVDLNRGTTVPYAPYGSYVVEWSADMRVNAYVSPVDYVIYSHAWGERTARPLTERDGARTFAPALSPDGTQVAYALSPENTNSAQLHVVNRDGSDDRLLTTLDMTTARFSGRLSWSPDARYIVYFTSEPSNLSGTFSPVLHLLETATGEVRPVGTVVAPVVDWSPDGAWLAYMPPNADTIEIVEATTGNAPQRIRDFNEAAGHNIIGDFISRPTFSPDSERLLFIDRNLTDNTTLVRVRDLTTGDITTLTTLDDAETRFEDVLWQPDGILLVEDLQASSYLDHILFHHVDPVTGARTQAGTLISEDYIRMVVW
ncbi:MAG: hypothetical protein AAFV33_08325 [Chloroflexota bacterium]